MGKTLSAALGILGLRTFTQEVLPCKPFTKMPWSHEDAERGLALESALGYPFLAWQVGWKSHTLDTCCGRKHESCMFHAKIRFEFPLRFDPKVYQKGKESMLSDKGTLSPGAFHCRFIRTQNYFKHT